MKLLLLLLLRWWWLRTMVWWWLLLLRWRWLRTMGWQRLLLLLRWWWLRTMVWWRLLRLLPVLGGLTVILWCTMVLVPLLALVRCSWLVVMLVPLLVHRGRGGLVLVRHSRLSHYCLWLLLLVHQGVCRGWLLLHTVVPGLVSMTIGPFLSPSMMTTMGKLTTVCARMRSSVWCR